MKVLVVGLGVFGFSLCETLLKEGAELIVVDNKPHNINLLKNHVSMAVTLDAKNEEELKSLPLKTIDVAICCIGDDMESSLLTTLHLKNLGVREVIARATSRHHKKILEAIGADEVIFPEEEVGQRLAMRIVKGHVYNYIPLSENHMILEIKATETIVGKKIGELKLRERYNINIVAIKQKVPRLIDEIDKIEEKIIEKVIDVPTPDYEIQEGDILVVVGKNENIERLREEI